MAKEQLKRKTRIKQKAFHLPEDTSLFDTHRPNPRSNGGTYTEDNTTVIDPVEHLKKHDNYLIRDSWKEELKAKFEIRWHAQELRKKITNQILAFKRGVDIIDINALKLFNDQLISAKETEKQLQKDLVDFYKNNVHHPLAFKMEAIKAIGPITIIATLIYLDPYKADHVSSYWNYCGYHCASHERYKKNQKGGGNKKLRSIYYTTIDAQIKHRGPYRIDYDKEKLKLEKAKRKH